MFAVDGEGVPSVGWIVKIDPNTGDTQAPTAPGALNATVADDDVTLNWNAADRQRRGHRSTACTGPRPRASRPRPANRIATVNSGTSYADNDLAPGTYHYRVVAADAAGNAGPSSDEANATVDRRRDGAHRVDHGAGRRRHRRAPRST